MLRGSGRRVRGGVARRAALFVWAVAWAPAALAATLPSPAGSREVLAGGLEVVPLKAAVAGVEERELILSLDGGRTFPLRLTGEIGPGDLQATWRVPALPTRDAVLALREGGAGRGEEIVAVSAAFTILPSPDLPAEELRFRDGEWRTREADSGRDGFPPVSLGDTAPVRCKRFIAGSETFEEPARALPEAPAVHTETDTASAIGGAARGTSPSSHSPLFLPLRE